jgi:hypothetical protein
MARKPSLPALEYHISGQATARFFTADGSRKPLYFGKHGSPEAGAKYHVTCEQYKNNDFVLPEDQPHYENLQDCLVLIRHLTAAYRERIKERYAERKRELSRLSNLCDDLDEFSGDCCVDLVGVLHRCDLIPVRVNLCTWTSSEYRKSMSNYFIKRGEKTHGPFSENQLRAGLKSKKLSNEDVLSEDALGPWDRTLGDLLGAEQSSPEDGNLFENVEVPDAQATSSNFYSQTQAVTYDANSDNSFDNRPQTTTKEAVHSKMSQPKTSKSQGQRKSFWDGLNIIGYLVFAYGFILAIVALNADTDVYSGGDYVHNLAKAHKQLVYMLFAFFISFVGVAITVFDFLRRKK